MVHYRQGTFHCYILSCVVSGDKRTTILISIRRKNTWLEPMKSAPSFCHWLRPSGPNKVFPFESTAVENYSPSLYISVFFSFALLLKPTMFVLLFQFSARFDQCSQNKTEQCLTFQNAPVSLQFLSPCLSLALYLSLSNLLSPLWWSKGWPCQSICQELTVLQHMHYTDGYHHSSNDCPPHWNRKTRERKGLRGLRKRKQS